MSKPEDKNTKVDEVQLDDAAVATLVEKTADILKPGIEEAVTKSIDAKIDEALGEDFKTSVGKSAQEAATALLDSHLEKVDEKLSVLDKKSKLKGASIDPDSYVAKGIEDGKFSEKIAKMNPMTRFFKAMRAMDEENGDREALKQYNEYALASIKDAKDKLVKDKGAAALTKTGYGNEATAADGAVLIPDADFVTTVFDNLPSYGVAFQYADVRQTDRTSVRVISLDSGLTFYSTAEAGVKTGAKLAFAKNEVSLQKYAVIVPATDEFTDDAVIDYWNVVTRELSRAYAKKADEIVFTDAKTGSGSTEVGGITNLTGVITENVSGAGTTVAWSDLLDLEAKLEDDIDTSNYRWFMRKETWYRLVETRGTTNDHYIAGSLNTATGWVGNINQPTTPWGTPVVFTRVLPTSNSVSSNDAFAVYGDLSNTLLYNKRGMALKMLSEATVKDSEGTDLNLATQDAQAMRAVIRMLHICPKGNRGKFGVLGTGTVS